MHESDQLNVHLISHDLIDAQWPCASRQIVLIQLDEKITDKKYVIETNIYKDWIKNPRVT